MALSKLQLLRELKNRYERLYRDIEMAIQFQVWLDDGPTGIKTPVYGGVWSVEKKKYIETCAPRLIPVSKVSYEILMDEETKYTELTGGRAGAKSYTAALVISKKIVQIPLVLGLLATPTYEHCSTVWDYVMNIVNPEWVFQDISHNKKKATFWNGHEVLWRSSTQNKSLRSQSAAYAIIDECQDIKTRDVGTLAGCVRVGSDVDTEAGEIVHSAVKTQIFECGTIKVGDFYDRHFERVSSGNAKMRKITHRDNPFVSDEFIRLLTKSMSALQIAIEIDGDWEALVVVDGRPLVFPKLDKEVHVLSDVEIKLGKWKNTTREITEERTGRQFDFIAGADYNIDYPHHAVIHQVFDGDILYAKDEILALGHGGHLGDAMIKAGYTPDNTMIVDDLSGRRSGAYEEKKAPSDRLRDKGFILGSIGKAKNPDLKNTVDSLQFLVDPSKGNRVRFFVNKTLIGEKLHRFGKHRAYHGLWNCLSSLQWEGGKLYKKTGSDITHGPDCSRYVSYYLWPSKKVKQIAGPIEVRKKHVRNMPSHI